MEDGGTQSGGRPEEESESYNVRARRAEVWPERKLRSGGCMGMPAAVCEHGGATMWFNLARVLFIIAASGFVCSTMCGFSFL